LKDVVQYVWIFLHANKYLARYQTTTQDDLADQTNKKQMNKKGRK